MITASSIVQQKIYYYIELFVNEEPSSLIITYDASGDEDVTDLRTITPNWNYSTSNDIEQGGGVVTLGVNLLTNKSFLVTTNDDEKEFDAYSWVDQQNQQDKQENDLFEFELEVGYDGQWWVDPHDHYIIDMLKIHCLNAEGEKIATSENGYSYQLRMSYENVTSTRIYVSGMPDITTGEGLIFEMTGFTNILSNGRNISGTAYGIWEG